MPWALWMARLCMDPVTGQFVLWPREGGLLDQDEEELEAIQVAWYVSRLFDPDIKKRLKKKTAQDVEFLAWLEEDWEDWEERWALGYASRLWMMADGE